MSAASSSGRGPNAWSIARSPGISRSTLAAIAGAAYGGKRSAVKSYGNRVLPAGPPTLFAGRAVDWGFESGSALPRFPRLAFATSINVVAPRAWRRRKAVPKMGLIRRAAPSPTDPPLVSCLLLTIKVRLTTPRSRLPRPGRFGISGRPGYPRRRVSRWLEGDGGSFTAGPFGCHEARRLTASRGWRILLDPWAPRQFCFPRSLRVNLGRQYVDRPMLFGRCCHFDIPAA